MLRENLLIVEDEEDIRELLVYNLDREGYGVLPTPDAEEAWKLMERGEFRPDLILLDLMLPGMDGYAFCRKVHADPRWTALPVIMLTARHEDTDIVAGLEAGADDYITKPFSPKILVARIRAVLRRSRSEPVDGKIRVQRGGLLLDRERHTVTLKGTPLALTPSEFKAIDLFMRRPGVVFSRYQIVDEVHGENYPVTDRSVDVLIVNLRKKLGEAGSLVETVRGVGYRMKGVEP